MKTTSTLLVSLLALLLLLQADQSAAAAQATGPHIEVELVSEQTALVPGQTQMLAVVMRPESQWHTYWRNPGDSGEAPQIALSSTPSLVFGDIQWPLPAAIPVAHLVNYGYSDEHLLMVPVSVPANAPIGTTAALTAEVSWLVCKEDCIPGWATLTLDLPIEPTASASQHAGAFSATRATLPETQRLTGQFELNEQSVALAFEVLAAGPWQVFPFRSDVIKHAGQQQQAGTDHTINMVMARSDYLSGLPESLQFLVSNGRTGYYLDATPVQTALGSSAASQRHFGPTELLIFAAMALVGGLILNVMPCVLPVLSIKALALRGGSTSRWHNAAYLLGVLCCFNAFALLIIGLQHSGEQLGWGFHMQSPWVIWLLSFLFVFIALVLLDVFTVGSRVAGIGEGLVTGNSASSHFFTGLLAVVVAAPCTAPFMAAALGVAMVGSPAVTLIIFNALAMGFALPLTLIFFSPRLRSLIPEPGAWMSTFKHALAFPMLATVAWLAWVYSGQVGANAQFVLLLALIAFAALGWGLSNTARIGQTVCAVTMIALLLIPLALPLHSVHTNGDPIVDGAPIEPYDPTLLEQLRGDNQVVLVNMTADWCITCKVNEQVAFKTDAVAQAFGDNQVHYMVGDWTNKNADILSYLQRYDRAGVPLYVVYAGAAPGVVLPQILTPGIVIDALQQAKQEISHVN